MKTILTLMLALFIPLGAFAQERVLTGYVKDALGESIPGATILEEGTQNGTLADIDGKYTLRLTKANSKIKVSFIGYKPQVISVGQQAELNVILEEDSYMLEETVITGYSGTQLRSKVTSSIAKVDKELLEVGLFTNPAQALSGAVAGLKVIQSSGNPGSVPTIILRGGTNLDGTGSPLIVVDGQIRSGMNDINPEDIESMDVLKDAGATAIYGARASNGVILITTKTGKSGKAQINFKAKLGINYLNNPYTFLGAEDYIYAQRTAVNNSHHLFLDNDGNRKGYGPYGNLNGSTPYGLGNTYNEKLTWNIFELTPENEWLLGKGWQTMTDPTDPTRTIIFKDTNPQDYNFKNPSYSQDYNVNMTGGNDRGSYYAGLGYNHSEGLPIDSYYKRYNFTFNGDYKITSWLKSESKFNFTKAEWLSMPGSNSSEYNYFGRVLSLPTTVRFEDEEGNKTLGPHASDGNQTYQADKWNIDNESEKFSMSQAIQINFMKDLYLRATANWYYDEEVKESFTKDYETTIGTWNTTRSTSAGFTRKFDQTYNAVLSFKRRINEVHNISLLAGTEYYENYDRSLNASGSGAPTDDFGALGLTSKDANKRSIGSTHTKVKIASYFGNISYDFKDRYLFSAVFRSDGYSSLHKDNRWGFFPGVSGGWIFSREEFMSNIAQKSALTYGKLRLSYGVNGNASDIGAYRVQGSYNTTSYDGGVGFLVGSLPLPHLKWEKTKTLEGGLELNFFENRLRTGFTYYNRRTSDKLANISYPTSTGFSQTLTNNGDIQNRGIEIEVGGDIISNKDWTWTASANIAYNKNKIISLPNNGLERNMQEAYQVYTGKQLADGSYEKIWVGGLQEGNEPHILYLHQADGIYKSYDEIPGDLIVETSGSNGQFLYGPDAWAKLPASEQDANKKFPIQPGDVKWRDVNGDGRIDSFDKVKVGNRTPHWTGGFNTRVAWKDLSLHVRLDYALDYYVYDQTTPWFLGNMQGTFNTTTDYFDTWTPDNPNAKYPAYLWADQLGKSNYNTNSTLFAYKGDYLAFRELSLSYNLPKKWMNKLEMQAASISVTGQNLGYWTAAKTVSTPEAKNKDNLGSGYSLPRTLLFGVNITF